jgi:hypothetical protein
MLISFQQLIQHLALCVKFHRSYFGPIMRVIVLIKVGLRNVVNRKQKLIFIHSSVGCGVPTEDSLDVLAAESNTVLAAMDLHYPEIP